MYCCQCRKLTNLHRTLYKEFVSNRWLSSISSASRTAQDSNYHICTENVTQHSVKDYMKFYTFPTQDIQTNLTNAVPGHFKDLSKSLNENTVLLRKPSLNVISTLEESNLKASPKFIIYGPNGSGKTLSLLHVIHYCLQNDWIVLHVPNAFRFIDSQKKTQVQESQWKTTRVDQPEESTLWLKMFRTMNSKFLTEVNTTQQYTWGKRESTEKDKPLLEVLEQGVGRSLFSTDAVGVILKEIQQNEQLKVLYAVDAFNGFFSKTSHKLNGKNVEMENLSLLHHFTKLLNPEHSLQNGAYVMALSQSVQYLKEKRNPNVIDDMLDENVLSKLGEFNEIEVPNYTDLEYTNIMNFYRDKGWLTRDVSEALLNEIQFLTNRNPALVSKFCSSL